MNAISGGGPPISARLPIFESPYAIDHTATQSRAPAQARRRFRAPFLLLVGALLLSACQHTARVAPSATTTTSPTPGFLGVVVRTLSAPLALQFGLTPQPGAVILEVTNASPAAAANLVPGDVIVDVASTSIGSGAALRATLSHDHAGQHLVLTVLTGATRHRVAVVLAPTPPA